MNYFYCLAALFLTVDASAQSASSIATSAQPRLQYDPAQLRIAGRSLPIGILNVSTKGAPTATKGFLGGSDDWSKYTLEVDGGSFSNGAIGIGSTKGYKKGDSITVNVYTRKWFLGKKNWLLTQRIPYDYEDSISILTSGNLGKAPGAHMRFGVRTWYDNKMFVDQWFPVKKKDEDFRFEFEGSKISASKGDLKIDNDPAKIKGDKVRLIAILANQPSIRDTLPVTLDYVAAYQCKLQSTGIGHDLNVMADVYFDTLINARLMKILVTDRTDKKIYNYLINTAGGSITISSKGADGYDGRSGWDGLAGLNGSDGVYSTNVQTVTAADGTTQSITTTVQGPGGNGANGGDGDNGSDGGNGSNGGNIVVSYTPAAAQFLAMIKGLSIPGKGGAGGRAGQGGAGGTGGTGNPPGNTGFRGNDGHSGFYGTGGKPGKVSFVQGAGILAGTLP